MVPGSMSLRKKEQVQTFAKFNLFEVQEFSFVLN